MKETLMKNGEYLRHYEIDSYTNKGIEELKEGIIDLILNEEKLRFSKQIIPQSYNKIEKSTSGYLGYASAST